MIDSESVRPYTLIMNSENTMVDTTATELALMGAPTPALYRAYLARARKAAARGDTETAERYCEWANEVARTIIDG